MKENTENMLLREITVLTVYLECVARYYRRKG